MFYFTSPKLLKDKSILVIFTTRLGGVSKPPYDSLNLSFDTGDEQKKVIKNRALLAEELGLEAGRLITAEQVHRDKIAIIAEELEEENTPVAGADALLTDLRDLPLVLFFADCVPIILVYPGSPQRQPWAVVGAVHAGWRGTLKKITFQAVQEILKRWSVIPEDLLAFIGPAIGPCCYQVNFDLFGRFQTAFPGIIKKRAEGVLDLVAINHHQLEEAGILPSNIFKLELCTSCHPGLFYSYRRDGDKSGRQAAVVVIKS